MDHLTKKDIEEVLDRTLDKKLAYHQAAITDCIESRFQKFEQKIQGKHETSVKQTPSMPQWKVFLLSAIFVLGAGILYYVSNPNPGFFYDYTFRIAGALLHGKLGLTDSPPQWLNEMVPFGDRYFSVFPLGSVLTMIPFALLKEINLIEYFPAALIVACIASASALFLILLSAKYIRDPKTRLILSAVILFGTWMWTNLAFSGAWQIALGLAVLGELGALYFILGTYRPILAGFFFALAFGNRTEIILIAPLFLFMIYYYRPTLDNDNTHAKHSPIRSLVKFLVLPAALLLLTFIYNYARFGSFMDFGNARIPGVLLEPWYRHGIFSIHAIPLNAQEMLWRGWKSINQYPYLVPTGFGGSIVLSSPFLLLLFRKEKRHTHLKSLSWIAIVILTAVLWLHGNPGGWQFSYRYAMILLPWIFIILLETANDRLSKYELILFTISIAINAYATYLFFWTPFVRP